MKNKKNHSLFKTISTLTIIIYIFVYIMVNAGYYEYSSYMKKELTAEQILKFEEDIKNGIQIDLRDYNVEEENYNNRKKRFFLKVSDFISDATSKAVKRVFIYLEKGLNT